jgi:glutamate decarboxylase
MRALVKLTLGYSLAEKLAEDLQEACETLAEKGGVHPFERKRVHTGTGY